MVKLCQLIQELCFDEICFKTWMKMQAVLTNKTATFTMLMYFLNKQKKMAILFCAGVNKYLLKGHTKAALRKLGLAYQSQIVLVTW